MEAGRRIHKRPALCYTIGMKHGAQHIAAGTIPGGGAERSEPAAPKSNAIDTKHIDVLDGVRALAILGVLWFHFWQQNWIMPYIKLPFLTKLGLPGTLSFDFLPRAGFLFVDCLLFLSAFCLFLPYARAALDGAPAPGVRLFFRKRAARILPSYYFSVLAILFFVAIPSGAYTSVSACLRDLLPTLTFTQMFFPNVLLATKLNGVLWTVAVEVQFYLLFPLLARAFMKKPGLTYVGMLAVSLAFLFGYVLNHQDSIRMTINQLPAFFGVFANGMAFSYLFVLLGKNGKRSRELSVLALAGLIAGLWLLVGMLKQAPTVDPVQVWQAQHRYRLSLVFALVTVSAALTFSGVRWLFSNVVMRFLAAISYNVYIWHQWIAVQFKTWRIPYWSGDTPPNMTGDTVWKWKYTVLILVATFAAAIFATYCVEHPFAKRILKRGEKAKEPMVRFLAENKRPADASGGAEQQPERDL